MAGDAVRPQHRGAVGIPTTRGQSVQIVAPGEFVVAPALERVQHLAGKTSRGRDQVIDLTQAAQLLAHRRVEEVLHILPPARVREDQVTGRQIGQQSTPDGPAGVELDLPPPAYLGAAEQIVPDRSKRDLVVLGAGSSNDVDNTGESIAILGIEPSCLDAHLQNRAQGDLSSQTTLNHILDGQAVDEVDGLPGLAAPDIPLGSGPWLQTHVLLNVVDWQLDENVRIDFVRRTSNIGLDERALDGDLNRLHFDRALHQHRLQLGTSWG